ncbi:MAG: SDR family NAD(P)-dependent oxidoreductase [Ktedonobacterales bacterium]
MARVFITGSSDGLGLMTAEELVTQRHEVVLHARNERRASQVSKALPQASAVVTGDLADISETKQLAEQANALGAFDAVIHNAGVGYREGRKITRDGVEHIFAINVLAPYVLTALISRPERLVYLSSGMHRGGDPADLDDARWETRLWNGEQAYSDSKLFDAMLSAAVARLWPNVRSNAVEPGWVATKMGGPGAPDDLSQGAATQVWLAVSNDPAAQVSGGYFYHKQPREPYPAVHDVALQDKLLTVCRTLSGVVLPA